MANISNDTVVKIIGGSYIAGATFGTISFAIAGHPFVSATFAVLLAAALVPSLYDCYQKKNQPLDTNISSALLVKDGQESSREQQGSRENIDSKQPDNNYSTEGFREKTFISTRTSQIEL